jgi:hypothetical protein
MTSNSIWDDLKSQQDTSGLNLYVRKLINYSNGHEREVYAAIDLVRGQPLLMTCIQVSSANKIKAFPELAGIRFELKRIPADPPDYMQFMICLSDITLEKVFMSFATDIAEEVGAYSDDRQAVDLIFNRLAQWQKMLRRGSARLTEEQQRGLLGELLFIRDSLLANEDLASGIIGWTGPEGYVHDFGFGQIGTEVKTISGARPLNVRINGEGQLNCEEDGLLFLYVVELIHAAEGSLTLPKLVGFIRNGLAGDSVLKETFERKLVSVGYHDEHAASYTEAYISPAVHIYSVTKEFPRLVSSSLPSGIGDVSYTVALSAADDFRCKPEDYLNLLKENLAHGR